MGLDVRALLLGAAAMTPPFPRRAVRAQSGAAIRRRQLPDGRRTRQAHPRAGGLVEEARSRSASGTINFWRSPRQAGPRPDAVDVGADARSALARPTAPGRDARQAHQQPVREDAASAPPIHDRHGRPQRGRSESLYTARAIADVQQRRHARHQPGLFRSRPADGRPDLPSLSNTRWASSCRC